jgi:pantetheine-phosphate adenylyltransferase
MIETEEKVHSAIYAGSFDPVTNGHLNIIERAAGLFDELTVSIVVNPNKKSFFTLEERMDIVRTAVSHLDNVKVDSFSGLLADYVNDRGFDAVVRGLRAQNDFESELQMAQMNARLYKEKVETVFLMTDPGYSFVSSSIAKEVCSLGGSIEGLVPEAVLQAMKEKYGIEK